MNKMLPSIFLALGSHCLGLYENFPDPGKALFAQGTALCQIYVIEKQALKTLPF